MESKILEKLENECVLSKRFLNIFDEDFLKQVSKLAIALSNLGIKFNSAAPFDENVDVNILKQFENLLLHLADTSFQDEFNRIKDEKKILDELQSKLEALHKKKKEFEFSEEDIQVICQNIEQLNKNIEEQTEQNKELNGNGLIKSNGIKVSKESLLKVRTENKRLKQELKTIRNELKGLAKIDLNKENLDEMIKLLDTKYRNFVLDTHF